jgi:hypothetical protein
MRLALQLGELGLELGEAILPTAVAGAGLECLAALEGAEQLIGAMGLERPADRDIPQPAGNARSSG